MTRRKKTRSLKSVTGGVKTGTKERTKQERKQRKEAKKAANPRKDTRKRSVYQKYLDENGIVDRSHAAPQPSKRTEAVEPAQTEPVKQEKPKSTEENLWDMLENPNNHQDTF